MSDNKLFEPCDEDHIYVCTACGKQSRTQAPSNVSPRGWDASCMMHAVLCFKEKDPDGLFQAVPQ